MKTLEDTGKHYESTTNTRPRFNIRERETDAWEKKRERERQQGLACVVNFLCFRMFEQELYIPNKSI